MNRKTTLLCLLFIVTLIYTLFYFNIDPCFRSTQRTRGQTSNISEHIIIADAADGLSLFADKLSSSKVTPETVTILKRIEEKSSLPLLFSLRRKLENLTEAKTNAECRLNFPDIYNLRHHNIFWQEVLIMGTSFFLLSAFFDDRVKGRPYVRIMVVTDRLEIQAPFCQIWHKHENRVSISKARAVRMYQYIENLKNYRYVSHIVSCPVTPGVEPVAVSLVVNKCDHPQNALRVVYNKVKHEDRQEFLVCYKAMHHPFDDRSQQYIEWFEFLKMMGVNKVHLHILDINTKIRQVFDYYEKQGMLETRDITLPGYQPNLKGLQHIYLEDTLDWTTDQLRLWEHIPYNDCFYRNMFKYKYIIVQDMDQVLIPVNHSSYHDLLNGLFIEGHSHLSFRNFAHYDQITEPSDIPSFMYMMSRVYRRSTSSNVNSIYNPILAGSAHSHYPLNCIDYKGELLFDSCEEKKVDPSVAFWHHYPSWPANKLACDPKDCALVDTSLWKYKKALIDATNRTINAIFN